MMCRRGQRTQVPFEAGGGGGGGGSQVDEAAGRALRGAVGGEARAAGRQQAHQVSVPAQQYLAPLMPVQRVQAGQHMVHAAAQRSCSPTTPPISVIRPLHQKGFVGCLQ